MGPQARLCWWRVLRSLQIPGAWLGAALWALHPVQVESVAWISEMKNTQSGVFYLLTILFFVRWLRTKRESPKSDDWNYGLTLLFAALAMASKSSTVVLPAVLALCAWWVEGRWQWRHLISIDAHHSDGGGCRCPNHLATGRWIWRSTTQIPNGHGAGRSGLRRRAT